MTDLGWASVTPRRCRRHLWTVGMDGVAYCFRCTKTRDDETSRRGKNNRNRGNAIEREVAKRLGLKRVGQYGGADDAKSDWLVVQVKSGSAFSERIWGWLKAIPVDATQLAAVVLTDAPGPGHRRRAVVVIDMEDWIAMHGPSGDDAA